MIDISAILFSKHVELKVLKPGATIKNTALQRSFDELQVLNQPPPPPPPPQLRPLSHLLGPYGGIISPPPLIILFTRLSDCCCLIVIHVRTLAPFNFYNRQLKTWPKRNWILHHLPGRVLISRDKCNYNKQINLFVYTEDKDWLQSWKRMITNQSDDHDWQKQWREISLIYLSSSV